jgi:hypothetical protein
VLVNLQSIDRRRLVQRDTENPFDSSVMDDRSSSASTQTIPDSRAASTLSITLQKPKPSFLIYLPLLTTPGSFRPKVKA